MCCLQLEGCPQSQAPAGMKSLGSAAPEEQERTSWCCAGVPGVLSTTGKIHLAPKHPAHPKYRNNVPKTFWHGLLVVSFS